jgi:hypothetical protein
MFDDVIAAGSEQLEAKVLEHKDINTRDRISHSN